MTDPRPQHRRHRHRSSPLRRFVRSLDLDAGGSRARGGLLLFGLAIAVVAVLVAGGVLGPGGGIADGSPSPGASATGSATASPGQTQPTPSSSLPAVATATPLPSPTIVPVGIVARRIRIDRLGIDLRIVEGDGIDAPMNKAAHYPGTGWPGGGVNIYIYAHAQTGMFLTLWDAQVGDDIQLDLVDGTTRHYVVTDVKGKVPWNALQYLNATPPERLTLQTSTSYTATAPRFVVIAEPVPSADSSPSAEPSP